MGFDLGVGLGLVKIILGCKFVCGLSLYLELVTHGGKIISMYKGTITYYFKIDFSEFSRAWF